MNVMTPKEVGEMLKVSDKTIKRIIIAGELAAIKVGRSWRVDMAALNNYINKRSTKTR